MRGVLHADIIHGPQVQNSPKHTRFYTRKD